jgi:excisionase family DNA binding protein
MSNVVVIEREELVAVIREAVQEALTGQRAEGWLDTAGAARYLSNTSHSVRDLVRRNGLPHHRAPGTSRLLFRASELDAWVAGQEA